MRIKDYPKTLTVNGEEWRVKFVRDLGSTETRITWGLCDPCDQTIYIRLGQSKRERFYTFIHEILHAVESEYGLEIPHELVNKLEKPLAEIILSNYFR